MIIKRRTLIGLVACTSALPFLPRPSVAQNFPSRAISMIVPFPAGGPYDVIGRVFADRMKTSLGQPIIVENIGGAGGSIGTGRAARAAPDGYTMIFGGMSTHVFNGALYSLPYDVVDDFTPISLLATTPLAFFARKDIPGNNLAELSAWLKIHPNATAAVEIASVHLVTLLFQKLTGVRLTIVPYRGAAPAMQDLLAGHIDLFFDTLLQLPLVRSGNIKAYAVTGEARSTLAPEIPTFTEMGLPELSLSAWYGLFLPKGTPSDIIGRLNASAVEALADPVVRAKIVDLGFEVVPRDRQTPEALRVVQRTDADKWWPLIKEFGIKAE